MTRHNLNGSQKYKLRRFLECCPEELLKCPKSDVQRTAIKELGFEITSYNLEGAAKDVGITLQPNISSNGCEGYFRHQKLHNDLCELVAEIAKRLGESDLESRAENCKCRIGK